MERIEIRLPSRNSELDAEWLNKAVSVYANASNYELQATNIPSADIGKDGDEIMIGAAGNFGFNLSAGTLLDDTSVLTHNMILHNSIAVLKKIGGRWRWKSYM